MRLGREISNPAAIAKLQAAINAVSTKKTTTLFEGLMGLSEDRWRLVSQLNEVDISRIDSAELVAILRRYKQGNEAERSAWRRLCKKWNVRTDPAGWTNDRDEYNRVRYVSTKAKTRSSRLASLYQMRELIDNSIAAECSASQEKDILIELRGLVATAIAAKP
jgi:hypothetical protein